MKDYTRDFSSGDTYFQGCWYDDDDELEAAVKAYEQELERKADDLREEMRGSEDVLAR